MKPSRSLLLISLSLAIGILSAQGLPPVFGPEYKGKTRDDPRTRTYLTPQRIVWMQDGGGTLISNEKFLLTKGRGQGELGRERACVMRATETGRAAILFDFGREIQGGVQLISTQAKDKNPVRVRLRFGESVSEAMSEVGGPKGATNDSAMRDFVMEVPWLGVVETGNTGFRFLRIDLIEPGTTLELKEISAIFTYRNIQYTGSFRSNDERLNKIWMTGAYTVHLNMQEYLWDGIKRDRLVWVGDLHPEVMTVSSVFGYNEVVPKSLDLARDLTPLPGWMNTISSYSLWWIIIQRDWFRYQGDLAYLKNQHAYLSALLRHLFTKVDASGRERLDGGRFLDWPSSNNKKGVDAGLQALMILAIQAGGELCNELGDSELASQCQDTARWMLNHVPDHNRSKQGAALMALAGLMPAEKASRDVIASGGVKGFSTFYGYYMLQAQAMAGDYQGALDNIRSYWGGMLDMGATTFWEDFDRDWMTNAAPIDELVPAGKKDIHGDFGAWCYKNLRHSLCHGWASGPTAWLSEHVLGVKVVEAGCKTLRIEPHLGDLEWVEGTFPTPYGPVRIEHRKTANGTVKTQVTAPDEVTIINSNP
ncbi:alpha-L-rhamnosidase [Opitutaceae bacterium TAV4]|nr:alpha-L-rhamnosidase [Opitutaceae bacterium TAV4]RRK02084.1 alpha-L-rhamnosidase [Opitutaceae bacterium TAV3]